MQFPPPHTQHTYVLTTMFHFDVLWEEFCSSLEGFLPQDCSWDDL